MQRRKRQRGFLLIVAVILIAVAATMAAVIVTLTAGSGQAGGLHVSATQALDVAESGAERAVSDFYSGTSCSSLSYANVVVGLGTYTASGTLYNPAAPTTLSGALSNSATTVPVVSSAGYAPQGRIRIDSEEIFYSAISGNNFTGAQRGAAGTTAAAHAAGASVLQNQCRILSTGTAGSSSRQIGRSVTGASTSQGMLTARTTNGSQSVTGIGFRPKAVIFYWTKQTAAGFMPQNSQVNMGAGFASGPANQSVVSITAVDRTAASDEGRRRSASNVILLLNGGGAPTSVAAQAALTSLDADGFTVNWTTTSSAYLIHYIALGGDISNAVASSFNLTTAGGAQAVAGVGFQPDFVMFLWGFTEAVNTNTANSELGLGFARSSTAQAAIVFSGRDNTGNNTRKRWQQRTDSAILLLTPTTSPPAQDAIVSFTSMDANGFTVTKSNAPAASTPIFYLAMKGGSHAVSAITQPGVTGNQSTTGVGFKPEQLILASFNLAATTAVSAGGGVSIGAACLPTKQGTIWLQDRSDNDPADANSYSATTDTLVLADGNAVGNTDANPSTSATADLSAYGTDGFTLNWGTTSAAANQILYWAIGPNVTNRNVEWGEIFP